MHYVVVNINTSQVLYKGMSAHACAASLEPGTCYAKASSLEAAKWLAQLQAEKFRKLKGVKKNASTVAESESTDSR